MLCHTSHIMFYTHAHTIHTLQMMINVRPNRNEEGGSDSEEEELSFSDIMPQCLLSECLCACDGRCCM